MIKVSNISKAFGKANILNDISFQINDGEIYGLIGYNGVGKTTLMKIICGIYRPDSGKIWMDQKLLYENAEKKSDSFFMTEEISAFSESTLSDMRKFYKGYYPDWSDEIYYSLVDAFQMRANEKIGRFSKGMQRQAGLILAFSTNVKHLFLDEAFDGLDFGIRKQVRIMMQAYVKQRNACILVSSHNLSELEELADHLGMLSEGNLIYDGSIVQMKERFQVCRVKKDSKIHRLLMQREDYVWLGLRDGVESYIVPGTREEVEERFLDYQPEILEIRHIKLEEYFQKERCERQIDWEEIFKK